ncbi:YibE/F family protein [Clostridium akagii]|uniref:YibE/F family protein n=1 Tax=Clostridium akagii TaxID=91623 RepID=UPI000478E0AA|nr:YibE/F family protein [Clostridium akagii]
MTNYSNKSKIIFSSIVLILFFIFLYFFNINHPIIFTSQNGTASVDYEKAKVLSVKNTNLKKSINLNNLYFGSQEVTVRILSGKHEGDIKTIPNYLTDIHNVFTKEGMTIIIDIDSINTKTYNATVYSYYRAPVEYLFIFFFFLALSIIGGKKGIKSILGIIFTFICIIFLFIPMIFNGYSPISTSFLIIVLTTCVSLFLLSGFTAKTLSAILGTIIGVTIAGTIAMIFGNLAHLDGLNGQNTETLSLISTKSGMQVQGLLLASILISSLGAVLDLSMSIASSIQEIYISNPTLTFKQLFKSGMNVGKDMMGTMANTLLLAFTGSSLTMLIVIYSYNVSFTQLMNMDMVSIEIIQGVTGSIAVILVVPIIAMISAKLIPSFLHVDKNKS